MFTLKIKMFFSYIFKNRNIWLLAFSCIVVAIVKTTMFNWSQLYLTELWNISPKKENYWLSMGMLFGFLAAGLCSDKFFCGRRWNANVLFHSGMFFLLLVFWLIPATVIVPWHSYLVYGICFFTFGLQALIFIAAVELSHERIRGTVAGLIMLLFFIASGLSNVPIGMAIQNFGWNWLFAALCGISILSTLAVWFCRPRESIT